MPILDLFKYYSPKYGDEDNLSFHSKGLFFQKPANFNDPWDCTPPHINIPRSIHTIEKIYNFLARNNPTSAAHWKEIKGERSRSEIRRSLEEVFVKAFLHMRSTIGICSFSFIPDSELLWAHYTKSHFGYMLHFQINIPEDYNRHQDLKRIATPIPVIYQKERKVWNFTDYDSDRLKFVYDYVRLKSFAWSYECEFRLLHANGSRFVKTPDNWLKSIVIGLNTERHLRDKIDVIGKALNVPVLTTVMNPKEYKIDIPGLKIDGAKGKQQYSEIIKSGNFEL